MKLKLKNIPIPEAHLLSLLLGIILQKLFPKVIFRQQLSGHLIGWLLIILGLGISFWAVFEAGKLDLSSPQRLITSGPYGYSRNPMYVGWTLIYLGFGLVVNSIWLILLFPIMVTYHHFTVIQKEERDLEQKFGTKYKEYRNQVRRYL